MVSLVDKCITHEGLEFYLKYSSHPERLRVDKPNIFNEFSADYYPKYGSPDNLLATEPRLKFKGLDYYNFWLASFIISKNILRRQVELK